jgi:hypothetical protein
VISFPANSNGKYVFVISSLSFAVCKKRYFLIIHGNVAIFLSYSASREQFQTLVTRDYDNGFSIAMDILFVLTSRVSSNICYSEPRFQFYLTCFLA